MSRAIERRIALLESGGSWWEQKLAAGILTEQDIQQMKDSELDALCILATGKPFPPEPGRFPGGAPIWPRS